SPHFFISLPPRHPPSTLFPYTTLFRSLPFVPRLASRAIRLKHSQELREVDVDAPHKRGQSHFSSYCWCIFILAHKAHRGIRAVYHVHGLQDQMEDSSCRRERVRDRTLIAGLLIVIIA